MIRRFPRRFAIISVVLFIIIALALTANYLFSPPVIPHFEAITEQDMLNEEDYLEDFTYAYDILERYYPFFEVNKLANHIDWLGNREDYHDLISESNSDEDFFENMGLVLADLNNDHTHLIDPEHGPELYLIYMLNQPKFDWRVEMVKIFEAPNVQARYNITNESIAEKLADLEAYVPEESANNVVVTDILPGEVAYIAIKQMLTPNADLPSFAEEQSLIKDYLQQVKDYPVLMIDIRGNGGGASTYWSKFLLPLVVSKTYRQSTYSFVKEGELLNRFKFLGGFRKLTENKLSEFGFSEEINTMLKDYSHYSNHTSKVSPNRDSIHFTGNLYLLVDQAVYSSAEKLASFAKESELAILVGERTGGDGIGSDPMLVALPNTGYILRFSKELGLTEQGSINELDQTEPDITISQPNKVTDERGYPLLEEDEVIRAVIEAEEL